jgi:hypothetical protein
MTAPEPPASAGNEGAQREFLARTFSSWRSRRGLLADLHRTGSFDNAIAAGVRPGMRADADPCRRHAAHPVRDDRRRRDRRTVIGLQAELRNGAATVSVREQRFTLHDTQG